MVIDDFSSLVGNDLFVTTLKLHLIFRIGSDSVLIGNNQTSGRIEPTTSFQQHGPMIIAIFHTVHDFQVLQILFQMNVQTISMKEIKRRMLKM